MVEKVKAAEAMARLPETDAARRRRAKIERLGKAWDQVFEALTAAGLRAFASKIRPIKVRSLADARRVGKSANGHGDS